MHGNKALFRNTSTRGLKTISSESKRTWRIIAMSFLINKLFYLGAESASAASMACWNTLNGRALKQLRFSSPLAFV
jgi:hypothetical protein